MVAMAAEQIASKSSGIKQPLMLTESVDWEFDGEL